MQVNWRSVNSSELTKVSLTIASGAVPCTPLLNRRWERASIRIFTYLSLCQACNWPRKRRRFTGAQASESGQSLRLSKGVKCTATVKSFRPQFDQKDIQLHDSHLTQYRRSSPHVCTGLVFHGFSERPLVKAKNKHQLGNNDNHLLMQSRVSCQRHHNSVRAVSSCIN